jgi:hypothetical protein
MWGTQARHLKLLYALAGLLWTGYYSVRLLARHFADGIPISNGTVFCLLLVVSVPVVGYVVLFMLFPRAGRRLRR